MNYSRDSFVLGGIGLRKKCWMIVSFVLVVLFSIAAVPAYAAPTQLELQQKVEELQKEMDQAKLVDQKLEMMEKNLDHFRENEEKSQENLHNTFTFFIGCLTVLLSVAVVVITYVIGQSRKDIRENFAELKTESERKFQVMMRESLDQHRLDFKDMMEEEKRELEQLIAREIAHKRARIVIIGSKDEIELMQREELQRIRDRGLTNIKLLPFDKQVFQEKLVTDEIDIIVYRYIPGCDHDPHMHFIVDELLNIQSAIPLIVYTRSSDSNDRVEGVDSEKLKQYPETRFANVPATLVERLVSAAYARK